MTVMADLVLRPIALLRKELLGKKRKGKYSQFVGKKKNPVPSFKNTSVETKLKVRKSKPVSFKMCTMSVLSVRGLDFLARFFGAAFYMIYLDSILLC